MDWIRRKIDKQLRSPGLVYNPTIEYGGLYYSPQSGGYLNYDGIDHDMIHGLIVIGDTADEAGTIAHEWRHHWQHFNGIPYDGVTFNFNNDYQSEVIRYFSSSKAELDALRCEYKYATIHEEWECWLYDLLK
jgi:hypothetical protein